MSRSAYYTDFVAMPLLALVLIAFGRATFAGIALGLAVWSLAEYVIHRHLFHALPLFRDAHDLHHAKPHARTGVTSWHSMVVFMVLALVLSAGVLAGIALGYLAYITAHHAVHHWTIGPRHPLYGLKMRHTMHHRGIEANFGVTTTLWDRVFRTYRERR